MKHLQTFKSWLWISISLALKKKKKIIIPCLYISLITYFSQMMYAPWHILDPKLFSFCEMWWISVKKGNQKLWICSLAVNSTVSTAMNSVVMLFDVFCLFVSAWYSAMHYLSGTVTEPQSPSCACTPLQILQRASGLISARTLFIPRSRRLLLNANIVTVGRQTDRPQQLSDKEPQSDTRGHVDTRISLIHFLLFLQPPNWQCFQSVFAFYGFHDRPGSFFGPWERR